MPRRKGRDEADASNRHWVSSQYGFRKLEKSERQSRSRD